MKYGIIYKATSPSGKVYIGQTTIGLNKRKIGHFSNAFNKSSKSYNTTFSCAIRKYGKENFKWDILHYKVPEQQINQLEIDTIKKYNSFKNGYNSTAGGEGNLGFKHSNETKMKMSKSVSREPRTQEVKDKISAVMKNRSLSEEHKNKISESLSGRSVPDSVKTKISKSNSGENGYHAKLTWEQVREIRSKYIPFKYTTTMLAKEYGVSKNNIFDIISGRSWKE